jgi:hypothetical protein
VSRAGPLARGPHSADRPDHVEFRTIDNCKADGRGAPAMIIETQADVTRAVLSELARAPDPRFREIMSAFIRHLHDFAREVKLTEQEFQTAAAYVNAIGKSTNENHNEAVLMAGSLGLSALV